MVELEKISIKIDEARARSPYLDAYLKGQSETLSEQIEKVQSLEAERDRLRDALKPFAEWARLHEAAHPEAIKLDNVHYLQAPCPEISDHTVIVVHWGHFAEARAAIGETPYCDRDEHDPPKPWQNADALWDALRKVVCSTRPHTDATAIVMLGRQDLDKALAAIEVKP